MRIFKRLWCFIAGHRHLQIEALDGHSIIRLGCKDGTSILIDACIRCDNLFMRIENKN